MGSVRKSIEIKGKFYWELFHTGSKHSYVSEDVANEFAQLNLAQPRAVAIGKPAKSQRVV